VAARELGTGVHGFDLGWQRIVAAIAAAVAAPQY